MAKHLTPDQMKAFVQAHATAPQLAKLEELAEKGFKVTETETFTDETGVFVQHEDGRFGLVTPRDGDDYTTSRLILAPRGKPLHYNHVTWQRN